VDRVEAQAPGLLGQVEVVLGALEAQLAANETCAHPGAEAAQRRATRRRPLDQATGVGVALVLAESDLGVRLRLGLDGRGAHGERVGLGAEVPTRRQLECDARCIRMRGVVEHRIGQAGGNLQALVDEVGEQVEGREGDGQLAEPRRPSEPELQVGLRLLGFHGTEQEGLAPPIEQSLAEAQLHQAPPCLERLLMVEVGSGGPPAAQPDRCLELRPLDQLQVIDAAGPDASAVVAPVPVVDFTEREVERDEIEVVLRVHPLVEPLQDAPVAGATEVAAAAVEDGQPRLLLPAAQRGVRRRRVAALSEERRRARGEQEKREREPGCAPCTRWCAEHQPPE
jgi:hypothetical protein